MTKTPTKRKTTSKTSRAKAKPKVKKEAASAFSVEKAVAFLYLHASGMTVSDSARALGLERWIIYEWEVKQSDNNESEKPIVFEWQGASKNFSQHFARAREMACDAIADQIMNIADTKEESVIHETGYNDKGSFDKTRTYDSVEHRKLRIWTRMQLLAKWSNRYSDKQKVELTGKDGGAIQSETKVVESMSTEELMLIAQMQTNEQGIDTGS